MVDLPPAAQFRQYYPAPPFAETSDIWINGRPRTRYSTLSAERLESARHNPWRLDFDVLDSAMGCAVHSTLKPGHGFTTVDMTVSFVEAVHPE